jgi:hypothetical protein
VYRDFLLVMLTLVCVFNFIDRQLLVILQEFIKENCSSPIPNLAYSPDLHSLYFT